MERPDFRHPRLHMARDPGALSIVLPVKAGRYRLVLDFVWLCVWLLVEAVLLATLSGIPVVPGGLPLLVAVTVAFSGAGCFLMYRLLWFWTGQERFLVHSDRLVIAREILGIGPERTFLRDRIRDVRCQRLGGAVIYPSWGRMFIGNGRGQILIELEAESRVYAKGLDLDEAEGLAELLRQELRLPSEERQPTGVREG